MTQVTQTTLRLLIVLGATAIPACGRPGGPGTTNEFGNGSNVLVQGAKCLPMLSAEVYPARTVVTHPGLESSGDNIVFTSVLWAQFNAICGSCHVSGSQGGFSVTQSTFSNQITAAQVNKYIISDDPSSYMPPTGPNAKPFSQRGPDDPVSQLARLLQLWIAQGSPSGQFYLSSPDGGT
ncbi:MAG: hypothetical protein ABUS79_11490, partial [Pseudomonadota bacterium]